MDLLHTLLEEHQSKDHNGDDDDEFVVIMPDCFNLDVPLSDFQLPILDEPTSDIEENEPVVSTEEEPISSSNTKEPTYAPQDKDDDDDDGNTNEDERFQTPDQEPKSKVDTIKKHDFKPQRVYLSDAVRTRSRQPLSYGLGLINTVTDLVDSHVHFSPSSKHRSNSTPSQEVPTKDEKLSTSYESKPTDLSAMIKQEPDVSKFINKKWEGPPTPQTAMDKLINMGFANRIINNRLLKKYDNHLPSVINELLETNGEGYQVV